MADEELLRENKKPTIENLSTYKSSKQASLELPSISSQNEKNFSGKKHRTSFSQGCSPVKNCDHLSDFTKGKDDFGINYKPLKVCGDISNDKHMKDLAAMSMLSIYQSAQEVEEDIMDTSSDFIMAERNSESHFDKDRPTINVNGINSSLLSNKHLSRSEDLPSTSGGESNTQNNEKSPNANCPQPTIFFKDHIRSVDFVLVWDGSEEVSISEQAFTYRSIFEKNLKREGLQLEYEDAIDVGSLNFVKIHVPLEVLRRYSEILKLRLPMRDLLCKQYRRRNTFMDNMNVFWDRFIDRIKVDESVFPPQSHRFTAIYSRDKEYLFDINCPCFFTPSIRSQIIHFILERKRFMDDGSNDFAFGITRLINMNLYTAAYPLHDGDLRIHGSMRNLLYTEWASVRKWYRYQPLDHIKNYFGVKIGLYFAWLGFYTHMLWPAALVGVLCFIYSLATLYSNRPSEDICNENLNIKMCPICDYWCDYWNLHDTCLHARVTYLFDNTSTVFFAIFMSFWATLFLEMWKRYSAEITHRWDLTGFDIQEEHPRPQYLARLAHVKRKEINVVTNTLEPLVPFWRVKLPVTIFSISVVLLLVLMAVAAVLAVVLYRMSVSTALSWYGENVDTSYALLFTTSTAAVINLVCIMVFNYIYTFVAEYLTETELLRTQTEFDDSLTLKIYLLQFVNYYSSIFYIAFFKGKFVGRPGDYNRFFGYRQEECSPGGCLLELSIQLAIIMVGKQSMNAILEMLVPLFWKWMNVLKLKANFQKRVSLRKYPRWVQDYSLNVWDSRSLFPEYLEMVLQYGFVTIFVSAFPLAPFFALLNNVLETRLDAKKLLTYFRRPVTQRVRDIGIWYRILNFIGKLSLITNAFIIAFTSDFIPRLVYHIANPDNNLKGYLNDSLSSFETLHFDNRSSPKNPAVPVDICRYPDRRYPPDSNTPYMKRHEFWYILVARLIFVIVFENIVALVIMFIKWLIPDMSTDLKNRIRREVYITNEIIINHEMLRSQKGKEQVHCPSDTEWRTLINKALSDSDFDLYLHAKNEEEMDTRIHSGDLKKRKKGQPVDPSVSAV